MTQTLINEIKTEDHMPKCHGGGGDDDNDNLSNGFRFLLVFIESLHWSLSSSPVAHDLFWIWTDTDSDDYRITIL